MEFNILAIWKIQIFFKDLYFQGYYKKAPENIYLAGIFIMQNTMQAVKQNFVAGIKFSRTKILNCVSLFLITFLSFFEFAAFEIIYFFVNFWYLKSRLKEVKFIY